MLRIVVLLMLFVVPLRNSAHGETCSRVGLSFGGLHIMGIFFEREIDETAVRAQVGMLIHAVSLNVSAVRYFDTSRHRPLVGIGYMKHFKNSSFQGDNLLCFPLGMDFELSGESRLNAELIPALSLSSFGRGVTVKRLEEYVFPLPCLSYKYKL